MAVPSILASAPDCQDVTFGVGVDELGQKYLQFTCQPGGQVIGIAINKDKGKITKLELAQAIADFKASAPQAVQDKLAAALLSAPSSLGVV